MLPVRARGWLEHRGVNEELEKRRDREGKGKQTGAMARDTVTDKLNAAQIATPSTMMLMMRAKVRSKSFPTGQPRLGGTETWLGSAASGPAEKLRPGRSAADTGLR